MWGAFLKKIREDKRIRVKEISEGIFDSRTVNRIERDEHIGSADKFIQHLNRLNMSFGEFCALTGDDNLTRRENLKSEIGEALRQQNAKKIKKLLDEVNLCKKTHPHEVYFIHMAEVLMSSLRLIETGSFSQVRKELTQVMSYLEMDEWYQYEIYLFVSTFHIYDYDFSKKQCQKAFRTINKHYDFYKNQEVTFAIFNNFAIKALMHNEVMEAHNAITNALAMPLSTQTYYLKHMSKVLHQIICFKLGNGQYSYDELVYFIRHFKKMDMPEVTHQLVKFANTHGIAIPL